MKETSSQLDKILALADSSYDDEALVAVRKARELMSRDGLSFGDLARAAIEKPTTAPKLNVSLGVFSNPHIMNLEAEVLELRKHLDEARTQNIINETQANAWKLRAQELEQKLTSSQSEAVRWRQMARDTVDKLWDLSRSIQLEGDLPDEEIPPKSAKK